MEIERHANINEEEITAARMLIKLSRRPRNDEKLLYFTATSGLEKLCIKAHEQHARIGPTPPKAVDYLESHPAITARCTNSFLDWVLGDFHSFPIPESVVAIDVVYVRVGSGTKRVSVPRHEPWQKLVRLCAVLAAYTTHCGPILPGPVTALVERAVGLLDLPGYADAVLPLLDTHPHFAVDLLATGLALPVGPVPEAERALFPLVYTITAWPRK